MTPINLILWIKRRNASYSKAGIRWMGLLRATCYGLLACAAVGTCSFRVARADMAEASMSLGRQLMPLADLFQENNGLVLNGQPIQVSTASTNDRLSVVLDRFEANCRDNNAAIGGWKDVTDAKPQDHATRLPNMPSPGIVREDRSGKEGTVMCVTRPEGRTFWQSVHDFANTRELSSLGKFRYAFVSQDKKGGSFVITAWTEGRFDVSKLMPPEDGSDAPGGDSDMYPRPPDAQRIFTAGISGTPYGLRVYNSKTTPEAAAKFYDDEMEKRGWTAIQAPTAKDGERFYIKDNIELALSAAKDPNDGATVVSMAEMGAAAREANAPPGSR